MRMYVKAGSGQAAMIRQAATAQLLLAATLIAIVATFLVAAPPAAHATESPYCGGANVAPKEYCHGAARTFNAEYGSGDQGSVCVGSGVGGVACSGNPREGVYKPVGEWIYTEPWIFNNLAKQFNTVHGIAFTP